MAQNYQYAGYESGIDRFIHPNKGQFIGRDALVQWREKVLKILRNSWFMVSKMLMYLAIIQ